MRLRRKLFGLFVVSVLAIAGCGDDAAEMFRRSGVRVALEGEEARIFDAVVKPERQKTNGNAAAEIERLEKEIARAEGMLANERFVQNAPAHVVEGEREKLERYRRELDALSS